MRITLITSKLDFLNAGGSIIEFDLICRTLQRLGHDITVVTAFSRANNMPWPLPYKVIEERIRHHHFLPIQWGLLKVLRKYSAQTDVFHVDGHSCLYAAGFYRLSGGPAPISALFNRELICWPENVSSLFPQAKDNIFISLKKVIRRWIEKYLGMPIASRIDFMSFTNPVLEEAYASFGLKTAGKSIITGDPYDYRELMAEQGIRQDSYAQRNKTNGPLTIYYSSRMVPGKGFDLLIMAFSKIKNKEKFHLILGGSGPEEPLIRQLVKDLRLEPFVELPGWVPKDQVYDFYKQADIFVQASWRNDMTSMSLLAAMTFGLPNILPAGGGLEWVAENCALYFKVMDCADLARKIEQLGDDYELRNELSRQCYLRLSDDQMNYEKQIMRISEGLRRLTVKGGA